MPPPLLSNPEISLFSIVFIDFISIIFYFYVQTGVAPMLEGGMMLQHQMVAGSNMGGTAVLTGLGTFPLQASANNIPDPNMTT